MRYPWLMPPSQAFGMEASVSYFTKEFFFREGNDPSS
jgi:hypothetical protein